MNYVLTPIESLHNHRESSKQTNNVLRCNNNRHYHHNRVLYRIKIKIYQWDNIFG